MSEQTALEKARILLAQVGFMNAIPSSVKYHPEGGKSLPNFDTIPNNKGLRDSPYWQLEFKVPPGYPRSNLKDPSVNAFRVTIFEEVERGFVQGWNDGSISLSFL